MAATLGVTGVVVFRFPDQPWVKRIRHIHEGSLVIGHERAIDVHWIGEEAAAVHRADAVTEIGVELGIRRQGDCCRYELRGSVGKIVGWAGKNGIRSVTGGDCAAKRAGGCGDARNIGAARHERRRALEAAVLGHVNVAVGVIQIEPVVLVREQFSGKAEHTRMVDVIERTEVGGGVAREVLVVVGVVMPLQIVVGRGDRSPRFRPVEGVHPIVPELAESHGSKGAVVIHGLEAAVDIPVGRGAEGGGDDAAVLVNRDRPGGGIVGRNRDIVRRCSLPFRNEVVLIPPGEGENGAGCGIPAHRCVVGGEHLAEVAGLRAANGGTAGCKRCGRLTASRTGCSRVQRRAARQTCVVDGFLAGRRRHSDGGARGAVGGSWLVRVRVIDLVFNADRLGHLPHYAVIDGDDFALGVGGA